MLIKLNLIVIGIIENFLWGSSNFQEKYEFLSRHEEIDINGWLDKIFVSDSNFKKNLIPELELLIIGSIDLDEPFVNILVRSEVAEVGFIERW